MEKPPSTMGRLKEFRKHLDELLESNSPISIDQTQRIKIELDHLFSIDRSSPKYDREKSRSISSVLRLEPSLLKAKLRDTIDWILERGDTKLIVDLHTAYARIRKLTELFKIYIPMAIGSGNRSIGSDEESACLESIFVDMSRNQVIDCVRVIVENLATLDNDMDDDEILEKWKSAVKIGSIFRSIVFASPILLDRSSTSIDRGGSFAEKLLGDLCGLMTKWKKMDDDRPSSNQSIGFLIDISSEIVVKLYLALSAYGDRSIGPDWIRAAIPKKTIGLPWRILLPSSDSIDRATESIKIDRLIARNLDDHDDDQCDECSTDGYCGFDRFWRSFFANFGLFQPYVSRESLEKVIGLIDRQKSQWKRHDSSMRRCLIDFVSVFNSSADHSTIIHDFFAATIDPSIDSELTISPSERSELEENAELKRRIIGAIDLNQESAIRSIFDDRSIVDDPDEARRRFRMFIDALAYMESTKNISDEVKSVFKEYASKIYVAMPILIARSIKSSSGPQKSSTLKLLSIGMELFAAMLGDRSLDLQKYPTISVALMTTALIDWNDDIERIDRSDFRRVFATVLKFLHIGMKKCNTLMIAAAPNWISILKRMQSKLFQYGCEKSTGDRSTVEKIGGEPPRKRARTSAIDRTADTSGDDLDDDWTPLFHRLGRFYATLDRAKELEKIAVYLIHDLIDSMTKWTLTELRKDSLESGAYRLIAVSDQFSLRMITSMMNDTSKELFRVLYENYRKYHKYTGQV